MCHIVIDIDGVDECPIEYIHSIDHIVQFQLLQS